MPKVYSLIYDIGVYRHEEDIESVYRTDSVVPVPSAHLETSRKTSTRTLCKVAPSSEGHSCR
jgi:hypothetical protein